MHSEQSSVYLDCFYDTDDLFLCLQQSGEIQMEQSLVEFYESLESCQIVIFIDCKHSDIEILYGPVLA